MLKRILGLLLAVSIIFSLSLTSVFAYSEENVIKAWDYSAADKGKLGELSGIGGKASTDNSKLLSADTEYAFDYSPYRFGNHTPTSTTKDIINGYFTMEFSVLLSDADSFSVGAHLKGVDNGNLYYKVPFYTAKNCVKNQWNRVALQYYSDGETTSTLTLFLNGEQVFEKNGIGSVAYFNTVNLKVIGGEGAVDDVVSYLEAYNEKTANLYTLAEGVSLNSFTNELVFADGEKVSDIKADIIENNNATKTFYKDSTYTQILADTDVLSRGNVVVITDGKSYNYITLSNKNVVKTSAEQTMTATTAGTQQTNQVTPVYQYAPYTSSSTTEIDGYITVEADVLFSGASNINFKVQAKNITSNSSPIYGSPFVSTALDEDEFGGNKYHKIVWEFYGDIDGTTKSQLKLYVDGMLYASKTATATSTFISDYSLIWTPATQDSYVHLKNIVAYEGKYEVDGYKAVSASDVFLTGTLSGLGGKEVNDNSQAVTNASYHANYIYQSYKTGYFTFEFSVLGVDTTDYKLTGTIYSSDLRSDNKNERVSKEFVAELPKLNEWHRVAFEFYRDENATTPKATVKFYVDGVQVSAVTLSELPFLKVNELKATAVNGTIAVDDMILYQGAYNYNGVSFGYTDNEKVSYDEENNKFLFVNGATVDELTSAISDFDGSVAVYSDSTCTTKLTDTDILTNTSVAVLRASDNNDIFRYIDIRIDDFIEFTYTNNEKIEYISDESLFIYKSGATVADLKTGFVSENGTTIEAYENENATVAMAEEALITDETVVKFTSPFGCDSAFATVKGKLSYYSMTFEEDETVGGNGGQGSNGETSAITYASGLYGKTSASKAQVTTLTSLENSKASVKVPVLPYSTPSKPDAVTTTEFSFAFKGGDTSYEGSEVNLQIQGAFNRTMADGTNKNLTGTSLWASFNDQNFKHERWNKVSITIYPETRTYTIRINGKIFRENVVITDTETDVVNKFGWLSVVVSAEAKEGEQTVNTVSLDDVICYYGDFRETDKETAQIALKDGTEAGIFENVIYIDSDKQFIDPSEGEYPLLPVSGSKISSYMINDGTVNYLMNANGIFKHDMVVVAESIDGTTLKYYDIKVPEAVYGDISLIVDGEYTGTLAIGNAGAEVTAYYPAYKAESTPKANLYLAIYSGNRLVELIEDTDTKTISGETVFSVSKDLESIEGLTVKAIFINDDLKPLSDSKTFR